MNSTSISWVRNPPPFAGTGFTWNPFAGCTPASKGCAHCYAARLAATRLAHLPAYHGLAKTRVFDEVDGKLQAQVHKWTGEMRFWAEKLAEPLRRKQPSGIFVGDMGDIGLLSFEQIAAIFGVMAACPRHRFYLLTKRPGRLREFSEWIFNHCSVEDGTRPPAVCGYFARKAGAAIPGPVDLSDRGLLASTQWPLPNVWVGASVCTRADLPNIQALRSIPAALRFVSFEPLLEGLGELDLAGIQWAIPGGESGTNARRCRVEWIRSLVRQCREAGTPVWVKQLGSNCIARNDENWTEGEGSEDEGAGPAWPHHLLTEDRLEDNPNAFREEYQGAPVRVHFRQRAGADPAEWPTDLRVQQTPGGTPA